MRAWTCRFCWYENRVNVLFCQRCGKPRLAGGGDGREDLWKLRGADKPVLVGAAVLGVPEAAADRRTGTTSHRSNSIEGVATALVVAATVVMVRRYRRSDAAWIRGVVVAAILTLLVSTALCELLVTWLEKQG